MLSLPCLVAALLTLFMPQYAVTHEVIADLFEPALEAGLRVDSQ
jgi:hypothetical protein